MSLIVYTGVVRSSALNYIDGQSWFESAVEHNRRECERRGFGFKVQREDDPCFVEMVGALSSVPPDKSSWWHTGSLINYAAIRDFADFGSEHYQYMLCVESDVLLNPRVDLRTINRDAFCFAEPIGTVFEEFKRGFANKLLQSKSLRPYRQSLGAAFSLSRDTAKSIVGVLDSFGLDLRKPEAWRLIRETEKGLTTGVPCFYSDMVLEIAYLLTETGIESMWDDIGWLTLHRNWSDFPIVHFDAEHKSKIPAWSELVRI